MNQDSHSGGRDCPRAQDQLELSISPDGMDSIEPGIPTLLLCHDSQVICQEIGSALLVVGPRSW